MSTADSVSSGKEERDKEALQSFLSEALPTAVSAELRNDSEDETKDSSDEFTRFHALTCLLGFLVLIFIWLIDLSGMFLNVRPFNCTAAEQEADHAISELPWSLHQGFRSSLSQQYKLCLKATGNLTNVAFLAGTIAGSLMAGTASDRFGRKPCMLGGLVLTSVVSLAGNYVPSFWLHLGCRSVAGCCMMFAQCSVQVYGTEVHSRRYRSRYLASWCAGASVGTLCCGLLAHLTRDHQLYVLVACCVPAAPLLLVLGLPESPAWLAARGRLDDSEAAFRRINAINGRKIDLPQIPVAPLSPPPSETHSSGCGKGWNCRLVRLACLIGFHGLCVGLNSYGFYFVMSGVIPDVCLYAALIGSSQLPYIFLLNLLPRRSGLLISSLLSGLISLGFGATVYFTDGASSVGGMAGVLLAGLGVAGCFCSVIAYNLLLSLSAESFPTAIRNTGLGLCTFCLRCGAALAPVINFLPGSALQSLVLGCPLLVSCLPMGLALCECGRSCGVRFFSDNGEAGAKEAVAGSRKLVIQIGNSQMEFDTKP